MVNLGRHLEASNGTFDARMTKEDLVKDLSPRMGSIGESAKHHQASIDSNAGTYPGQHF